MLKIFEDAAGLENLGFGNERPEYVISENFSKISIELWKIYPRAQKVDIEIQVNLKKIQVVINWNTLSYIKKINFACYNKQFYIKTVDYNKQN